MAYRGRWVLQRKHGSIEAAHVGGNGVQVYTEI